MRSPQYPKIDPFQSCFFQFWPHLPSPHAIFPDRRGQFFGREKPSIGSAVWRGLEPILQITSQTGRQSSKTDGFGGLWSIQIFAVDTFANVGVSRCGTSTA